MKTYTAKEVSIMLGCSQNSLCKRARRLKIKKKGAYYEFTRAQINALSKKPSEYFDFSHVRIVETYYIYQSKMNFL